jgi:2-hydroxychromene-2-carboxylate isomerase
MRLLFAKSQHVQSLYKTYSDEAERLGVFGAPTYVLNGERFWGQDRLDFLDRALDAEAVGIDAIAGHGNPA